MYSDSREILPWKISRIFSIALKTKNNPLNKPGLHHACSRHAIFHPRELSLLRAFAITVKLRRLQAGSRRCRTDWLYMVFATVCAFWPGRRFSGNAILWLVRMRAPLRMVGRHPHYYIDPRGAPFSAPLHSAASSSANHPECDPHDNARPLHPDGNVSYPVYVQRCSRIIDRSWTVESPNTHIVVVEDKQKLFIWDIKIPIFFSAFISIFI